MSTAVTTGLVPPHGNRGLVNLLTEPIASLKAEATTLPQLLLNDRQLCDVECIMNGAFSPLTGFMNQADYERVVNEMRLADGTLWPMPITLDVNAEKAAKHPVGSKLALIDGEGNLIAIMTVESSWVPDKAKEAEKVFGANDVAHPSVTYLHQTAGTHYLGGSVRGAQLPVHYDYNTWRLTPQQTRAAFASKGWTKVVGFQTRNPMHRSHVELTQLAAKEAQANLMVHPVVGMTKPGDVDHYTRVRCYKAIMDHYPTGLAMLSLLPLAMRMGGPREALWHALIRKNFGCTHFVVGRDHAGPGNNSAGKPFYGEYEAQAMVDRFASELGIQILKYHMVVYVEDRAEYMQVDQVPEGARALTISGTELRRRLFKGIHIPEWFTYPEVVRILRQSYPARKDQGFTVFFTGLSGGGKSTLASALRVALLEDGRRPVTLLDGDKIRHNLSSELDFSREHRDLNVQRVAYVASVITKSRGIAICAMIAPYAEGRRRARDLIAPHGGFVEVYVSTPLEVCESRDRTGIYAKARSGELPAFTGISDPYDAPQKPEITIDLSSGNVQMAIHEIILWLDQEGYLASEK